MSDNKQIPATGTGSTTPTIATDEIGGVDYQRVKVVWGADGVATDTAAANPLPVVQTGTPALPTGAATEATLAASNVLEGAVTETAPATDTASSGLNGRLQRIAQRLTSLIALLPASLGQKTMANGLAVTIASDQSAVPVSGTVTTTPPSNASTNLAQVAGASTAVGHGVAATALRVELPTDGTGIVGLATGANAIGKLAANSGVDIGDVDVTSLPALPAGSNAIGSLVTPTSGGATPHRLLSAATTNATSVKGSAGQLYGWYLANAAAYTVFLKLYDSASAPTPGSGTPVMTLPIPAGAVANVPACLPGIAFASGIGYAITKLIADADTTAVAANDLVVNLFYK